MSASGLQGPPAAAGEMAAERASPQGQRWAMRELLSGGRGPLPARKEPGHLCRLLTAGRGALAGKTPRSCCSVTSQILLALRVRLAGSP